MLEFNKELHQYKVNGVILPSVSEVMTPLSVSKYSSIPPYVLEKARERGIGVHQAIDDYITFGVVNDDYRPYVEQFKLFLERSKLSILANEIILTNGIYCGTVDLVMVDDDLKVYLVDIKATSTIQNELLSVQLCAYKELIEQKVQLSGCFVLWLKENKYQFKAIEPNKERWHELLEEFKNKGNGNI